MKYLIAIATILTLSGCGYGYSVQKNMGGWTCRFTKPIFFFDNTVAACQTKEECTKICIDMRLKKK